MQPVNGMAETTLIQLRDVSRIDSNSGKQLLNCLSLTVGAGDRLCLLGASGVRISGRWGTANDRTHPCFDDGTGNPVVG